MGNCFVKGRRPDNTTRKIQTEKKRYKQMLSEQEAQALKSASQESAVNIDQPDNAEDSDFDKLRARLIRSNSVLDPVDAAAIQIDLSEYDKYPFENLVFEGGGNKGLAYVGAVRCLEELSMMQQIKRVGGASAGAITAALVAFGYSSEDICVFLSDNIEDVFLDHSCGYLSLLPNLIRNFGWNPGKKIYNWFGDKIKNKTESGDPDITFFELYKEKNVELCIVVTNLNLMTAEYCHPKTTPDMPIRDALRMTMSIPGVFTAQHYDNHGEWDCYVDGGVLCNYPIHCFDGWYLSLKREDAFLRRFRPLKDLPALMDSSNRFKREGHNRTLGFLLYDDTEKEIMRFSLEKRIGACLPKKPVKETKLYKKKAESQKILEKAEREHGRVVNAVESFMLVLDKHSEENEFITKTELSNAMTDETFPKEQRELLFGKNCTVDTAFTILDKDGNNRIAIFELVQFIEEHGIRMQTRFQGFGRRDIKSFFGFLNALQGTLLTNMKYVFVGDGDVERTVGINTGHVGTSDYTMEPEDRDFTVNRGYHATQAFLRYFKVKHPDEVGVKTVSKTPAQTEICDTDERSLEDGKISTENHKLL